MHMKRDAYETMATKFDAASVPATPRDLDPTENPELLTLQDMLASFVLVYTRDEVWDLRTLQPMKVAALRLAFGRRLVNEWLAHPSRRMIDPAQVVFDPTGKSPADCVNLFKGFPLQARSGDCSPLLELLEHLVSEAAATPDGVQEVYDFVLNWLALPLQQPGAKMATALVFHGPQGSGKSLFFRAVSMIYGDYAKVIGQAQLESKYNDWASGLLLAIAEEVLATGELLHFKNALKGMITGEWLQVESKFQSVRRERNHANFVFLSNEARPLALEADDRRHMVVYVPEEKQEATYQQVIDCMDSGGVEALYHFLLQRPLGSFNTHARAPMTAAKRDLVELGLRPAERFVRDWLAREIDLPLHPCTTGQLYRAFSHWCREQGERSVANQSVFTSAAGKYARKRLERRVHAPSAGAPGKPMRLWTPLGTGAPEGVKLWDFAVQAQSAFEQHLVQYCRKGVEP
jgi:putative DNA primase/helicase